MRFSIQYEMAATGMSSLLMTRFDSNMSRTPLIAHDPKEPKRTGHQISTFDPNQKGPPRSKLPLGPALRIKQAQALKERLYEYIEGKIDLVITDNRAVMLTIKRDLQHKRYCARVHFIFDNAPDEIVRALARYITLNDAVSSAILTRFIDFHEDKLRLLDPKEDIKRAPTLRTKGRFYDLQLIFDQLNMRFFEGKLTTKITWGRNQKSGKARSSIRLGSFTYEEELIRIHPGLDRSWVPEFYLQWIIYHEMLHVVHPVNIVKGRRRFHTPEFHQAEARFPQAQKAQIWEQRNLPALLML